MTDKKQQKESWLKREIAYGITGAEWTIASLMGIGSGIVTAGKTIRDRFHHDLKKSLAHAAGFERHAKELAEIKHRDFSSFDAFVTELSELKKRQFNEVGVWAKEYRGVEDSLIKGTIQRFKTHSPRSRASIVFNGIIGSAVGAGMALSFFNGVATRDRIEKIENAVIHNKNER